MGLAHSVGRLLRSLASAGMAAAAAAAAAGEWQGCCVARASMMLAVQGQVYNRGMLRRWAIKPGMSAASCCLLFPMSSAVELISWCN